jgi:hypothetical protein
MMTLLITTLLIMTILITLDTGDITYNCFYFLKTLLIIVNKIIHAMSNL